MAPADELFVAAKGLAARASGFGQKYETSKDALYRRRERAFALASMILTQAALETWINHTLEVQGVDVSPQQGWIERWCEALRTIPAKPAKLPDDTETFFARLSAIRKRAIHNDKRARGDFTKRWDLDDPREALTGETAQEFFLKADRAFSFAGDCLEAPRPDADWLPISELTTW